MENILKALKTMRKDDIISSGLVYPVQIKERLCK